MRDGRHFWEPALRLWGAITKVAPTHCRDGRGRLIYLRGQEGRGIGLNAKPQPTPCKIKVGCNRGERGPGPAGGRAALRRGRAHIGGSARRRCAATNNPAKCEALEALGVRVHERVPVLTEPTPENYKYLRTKQDRMGHRLELE